MWHSRLSFITCFIIFHHKYAIKITGDWVDTVTNDILFVDTKI